MQGGTGQQGRGEGGILADRRGHKGNRVVAHLTRSHIQIIISSGIRKLIFVSPVLQPELVSYFEFGIERHIRTRVNPSSGHV